MLTKVQVLFLVYTMCSKNFFRNFLKFEKLNNVFRIFRNQKNQF
jgi:hypothetical protein